MNDIPGPICKYGVDHLRVQCRLCQTDTELEALPDENWIAPDFGISRPEQYSYRWCWVLLALTWAVCAGVFLAKILEQP